jgi:hypothetical protein
MLIKSGQPGRARGYYRETGPEGTVEHETFTCAHCQRLVKCSVPPNPDIDGWNCRQCFARICRYCASKQVCDPFERKLERIEARASLLKAVGIGE